MTLFWRRKKTTREQILHGIYLENLKTFGHLPSCQRPGLLARFSKTMVLMVVAAPALLLGHSGIRDADRINPSFTPTLATSAVNRPVAEVLPTTDFASPQIFRLSASGESASQPSAEQDEMQRALASKDLPALRKLFGLSVHTIVIDPGHGGIDPGTSGKSGLQEKTVTLDIAKQLKERLEQQGKYKVILTRDADKTVSLKERVAFANSQHADLFISIHVNYLPNRPNNLIETYYYGVSADPSGLNLAQRENSESDVAMHEFSAMVEKLGNTLKLQESRRLASDIQRSLYANIGQDKKQVLDLGIRKGPFLVIMGTEMPGVLAEVTSMSNVDEEKKLQTAEYRREIASYLESGIINYLNKGDYIYEAKR